MYNIRFYAKSLVGATLDHPPEVFLRILIYPQEPERNECKPVYVANHSSTRYRDVHAKFVAVRKMTERIAHYSHIDECYVLADVEQLIETFHVEGFSVEEIHVSGNGIGSVCRDWVDGSWKEMTP